MKQDVSETESNWCFRKNVKKCLQNKKSCSIPAFEAWRFSPNFNFTCKDGRVATATCKNYCLLVVNAVITNFCKELHLKCGGVPWFIFEIVAMQEDWFGFAWKQVFFLFWNVANFIESHCFSLLLFTVWWSIFYQLFGRLLPLSCFYGSSQWLFKVKITCKKTNLIKK